MRYEFWLGFRYLFAKRRERFVSVIAALSIGGVALGVAALLVVLAVMSGFDHDIKEKLVGTNAHVIIEKTHGLDNINEVIDLLSKLDHVVGAAPFVTGQAILRLPSEAFGVIVRGIDITREIHVNNLADYLTVGHLPQTDQEVAIGTELSVYLKAWPGDTIKLISPSDGKTHELVISGLFRSGMYQLDSSLVIIKIARAQTMYDLQGVVSGIGVKLDNLENAYKVKQAAQVKLGNEYSVRTWMDLNQVLFDALKLEKLTMFVILTLIVVVASMNIISTLIMMVIEKTRDIGILKSIGATSGSIRALFTWEGILIGLMGITLGAALAGVLIWLLDTYELIKLPSSIYYLDHLPVRLVWADWVKTIAAAFTITLISTIYPAHSAAKLTPVEALRYE